MQKKIIVDFEEFDSVTQLSQPDQELFKKAQEATKLSYAPYSKFCVGAAIRLDNGEIILGSNQENASFGAVICAERVALSTTSSIHPNHVITTIAITYKSSGTNQDVISPCGICRQSLLESEDRTKTPIKIILSNPLGHIITFKSASDMMPLHFSGNNLL